MVYFSYFYIFIFKIAYIYFPLSPLHYSHIALQPPNPPIFMGKRPPPELQYFTRRFSERLKSAKINDKTIDSHTTGGGGGSIMEGSPAVASASSEAAERRVPLGEVVADCVRRWFQDTLKEARNGDTGMQVLVGQMYHSGYGIARNNQKAKAWITKASKYRSSVWKVSDKHPGYNASDSDSDVVKDDKK